MVVYSKELAAAAEWIWKHKDEPQYWEWQDLTARNPAPDTLNLPDTIAWHIFTILKERNLMLPYEATKDGKKIPAFRINPTNEDEWKKAKTLPTNIDKYFWEPLAKAGVNIWLFLAWILSIVIASSLTYGLQRLIDLQWPPKNG